MLLDAATNWARTHCFDPKLQAELCRQLRDAMQLRVDLWIGVGQALTRERAPYLLVVTILTASANETNSGLPSDP